MQADVILKESPPPLVGGGGTAPPRTPLFVGNLVIDSKIPQDKIRRQKAKLCKSALRE